jgi:hypothetical protein
MTTDPMTTDPMTTDPMTTDPMTTDPMTTDPMTTDPMTTDPEPPKMTCQKFVEIVTDYLEGVLASEVVEAIDAHLEVCPRCVTVVDQWREVISLAGQLHPVDVDQLPSDVRADLMTSFRSAFDG